MTILTVVTKALVAGFILQIIWNLQNKTLQTGGFEIMKVNLRNLKVSVLLALAAFCILATTASAQDKAETKTKYREFCSNNNYSDGDRVSFSDTREMTVAATGSVAVDGGQNGGVRVKGENRSDVLVRACIQTWGKTDEEAKTLAASIRIETAGIIKAESSSGDKNWSVSYEITAPRATSLNLKAHNGGISIAGIEGNLEFETMNGGVTLKDIAGDVKGHTTNGGVMVALTGNRWNGGGLDVQTTNGGVMLSVPENFAAHIETGTVNGGFKSDFAALNVDRTERWKPARISA
ncbi:MAG: DUF4097 family beta strand repeat-containing protein, partial [Pyrinomonadaceae bacterium]